MPKASAQTSHNLIRCGKQNEEGAVMGDEKAMGVEKREGFCLPDEKV
jgi:hypothetical protein